VESSCQGRPPRGSHHTAHPGWAGGRHGGAGTQDKTLSGDAVPHLSARGNPRLGTLAAFLKTFGLRLTVQPRSERAVARGFAQAHA